MGTPTCSQPASSARTGEGGKGTDGVALEIKRLHLASPDPPGTRLQWPVHGFVVTYPGGAALVDTGVGGPQGLQDDWRVVNVGPRRRSPGWT